MKELNAELLGEVSQLKIEVVKLQKLIEGELMDILHFIKLTFDRKRESCVKRK